MWSPFEKFHLKFVGLYPADTMATTLYHRTGDPDSILVNGFHDSECTFVQVARAAGADIRGAFFSESPLAYDEASAGEALLAVRFDPAVEDLAHYELVEEGNPYRWWIIPPEFVKAHAEVRRIDDRDTGEEA